MEITSYFPPELMAGKVVLITGGGSGINLGIARNFAAVGAHIAICGRTQEKLDRAAAELADLGATVLAQAADVREFSQLESLLSAVRDQWGRLDVLVCGAAGNFLAPAEQLSANGFKAVVDIDLLGSFNACRAAFSLLKESRGSITFISAGQAFIPYPMQVHAGAAKAGIDNLMKNLALEWGRYGIRSNSIAPGPIEGTEGVRRLTVGGMAERFARAIPLGRYGTVDEIGHLAVFLASPLAAYITGTLIVADGGQNLLGSGLFGLMLEEGKPD